MVVFFIVVVVVVLFIIVFIVVYVGCFGYVGFYCEVVEGF